MDRVIQNLSNVYTTLGELKVTGRESYAMYMCMKTLEQSIAELSQIKQDNENNKEE